MATLTQNEQATIAANYRSLESIAEELLEAAHIAEEVEDADDLDGIVRLLRSAYDSLRWLHGDLNRLNDTVQDRGELCDGCGTELCATCGECPSCGDCDCGDADEEQRE